MTSSGSLCWTVDGASLQFLDRVVDISVMLRDMYAQCSTVVSSGLSFDMPVVLATGAVLGQGCLPVVFTTTSRYAQCKLCRRRGFHSAVLGWSTCPLVCKRQGFGQTVEKTVVPQLHSSDKVVAVPLCESCRFSGASVEETVVSHSCSC